MFQTYEMLVYIYQTSRRHSLEGRNFFTGHNLSGISPLLMRCVESVENTLSPHTSLLFWISNNVATYKYVWDKWSFIITNLQTVLFLLYHFIQSCIRVFQSKGCPSLEIDISEITYETSIKIIYVALIKTCHSYTIFI
jgi:hypothetical protein